jgi:hypothetical protein
MSELHRRGLRKTQFAKAQYHTIRLKLLNIGVQVRFSVRRIYISESFVSHISGEFLPNPNKLEAGVPSASLTDVHLIPVTIEGNLCPGTSDGV